MLRGLWKLTWLEIKIFVREPLGLFGTVGIPVLLFVALGRLFSGDPVSGRRSVEVDLPVFSSLLIALNAVLSLVTVIAIYREGGILKRLRATPLRPHVILTAHVVVKLLMTAATLVLTILVGARYYPIARSVSIVGYGLAFLFVTTSVLSIGFVIASLVPTARFTGDGAADSSHVCRVPAQGNLEGGLVGGSYGRHCRAHRRLRAVYRPGVEGLPMGIGVFARHQGTKYCAKEL